MIEIEKVKEILSKFDFNYIDIIDATPIDDANRKHYILSYRALLND